MNPLVVIGGGPAGEAAARAARARKADVVLVERENVGGLCLNRGCIPSKTLLSFGKKIHGLKHSPILRDAPFPRPEELRREFWNGMKKEKDAVVSGLRGSLEKALKAAGVEVIHGEARFESPNELSVASRGGTRRVPFSKAVLAPGSAPIFPPPLDENRRLLLSSDEILELPELPEKFIVLGGGAVGCEFACLLEALGCRVTLIEKTPQLLPEEDAHVAAALRRSFDGRGIRILTSVTVTELKGKAGSLAVALSDGTELEAGAMLVSAGRRPDLESLDLASGNVAAGPKGIRVDETLRTSNPDVYAAGDATGLSLLAHAGSAQGELAADNALGGSRRYDGSRVPRCLYTWPEVASVGLGSDEARGKGFEVKAQRFFFQASGRALAEGSPEGFIQIVSDVPSDRVLGAQIIGAQATEIVHVIAVALQGGLTRRDLRSVIFAHPSFAEGIRGALER